MPSLTANQSIFIGFAIGVTCLLVLFGSSHPSIDVRGSAGVFARRLLALLQITDRETEARSKALVTKNQCNEGRKVSNEESRLSENDRQASGDGKPSSGGPESQRPQSRDTQTMSDATKPSATTTHFEEGAIIGMGASCFASYAADGTVLKGYQIWVNGKRRSYYESSCEDALAREAAIYKHLGEHPQILRCFGLVEIHPNIHSLRLELAPLGNIRQYVGNHRDCPIPERNRLQMAFDIATGLSHAHSRNVQHSDLSCRNLFLFQGYRVKIGDFGGSLIQGSGFVETVCEEMAYELPCRGRPFSERPVTKREIFALGSAIFEIMAWRRPFEGLEDNDIEARYAREEFPSLDNVPLGPIISNCWNEAYETAEDAVISLREHLSPAVSLYNTTRTKYIQRRVKCAVVGATRSFVYLHMAVNSH